MRRLQGFALGLAKSDAYVTQHGEHFVAKPRGVTKLKRKAHSARQSARKVLEQFQITLQKRRQLEEYGTEPARVLEWSQGGGEFQGQRDRIAKALHVSDFLVCLDREFEIGVRSLNPPSQQFLRREAAKRVVQLHRVQAACVVTQELSGSQLRGIERGFPTGVRPSRSACINGCNALWVYRENVPGLKFNFLVRSSVLVAIPGFEPGSAP